MAPLVTLPAAGGRTRYDPKSSFISTALCQGGYPLIAVSSQRDTRSLDDLKADAGRAAAPLTCGTAGNRSSPHFACGLLARALGIKLTMVAYKGKTFAMQDAAAGQIDIVPAFASELASFLEARKLRALAVLGPDRIPLAAMVPTVAEAGYPGQELWAFSGLYYRAGTPKEIVQAVNRAAVKAMQQPDIAERLRASGGNSKPLDANEFARFFASQQASWKQLGDSAGIKAESD